MTQEHHYAYYASRPLEPVHPRHVKEALALGEERFAPSLCDADYLVLRERRRLLAQRIVAYRTDRLKILNVGGRIQPYRPLFSGRERLYVAVDPQFEGLVDILAVGEALPFTDEQFDLVTCTQVLSYVTNPCLVAQEIYRVLRPGGALFLSAPALFPEHHDERWRFLPDGLRLLLAQFSHVEVLPEGHSIAGLCRTLNVCIRALAQPALLQRVARRTAIPFFNLVGRYCDPLSRGNNQCTANYSVWAVK